MQKGNAVGDSGTDLRAVLVIWRDSHSMNGWREIDEYEHTLRPIVSVGLVHREDESAITISTSVSGFDQAADPLTIPREAICLIRRIKLPPHSTKRWRTKPARE